MQLHMLVPLFLIGVGGVLIVDGVAIHDYLLNDNSIKFMVCRDALANNSLSWFSEVEDIPGEAKYIPIEFAGAAASLVFYVSYH